MATEAEALEALERARVTGAGNYAIDVWALDSGDPWGEVMGMLFALAECIRAATGEIVKDYTPAPSYLYDSPNLPGEYGEDWITTDLWDAYEAGYIDMSESHMKEAFNLFMDYRDALEAAGKSY